VFYDSKTGVPVVPACTIGVGAVCVEMESTPRWALLSEDIAIANSKRPRYTVADVRRSFPPHKRWSEFEGELPVALLYRPISYYLSVPLLNLGVPVLAVTLTSGLLALTMLAVAWNGGDRAYLVVVGAGLAFHLLDCVDGNMARTAGKSSRLGGLVDGFIDMSFWCALFVSLGLLVEHAGGGIFGDRAPEFALLLGILVLLNRQTRDNLALNFGAKTYFTEEVPDTISLQKKFLIAVVGLENIYVFAILIGGYFGALDKVLAGIGTYVVLMFVGAMVMTFGKASEIDAEERQG
jgi:hypothetical protein